MKTDYVCPKCVVEELEELPSERYLCPKCKREFEELALLACYEWEVKLLTIRSDLLTQCAEKLSEKRNKEKNNG